jgi:predicted transcriptional regulator
MTKLFEHAIEQVRSLADDEQDEAAEILLSLMAKRHEPVPLDKETRAAIEEGLKQARRGEFVSDEDMAAFFKQHGV